MARKKYYLTLDTETATLPFANTLCLTAEQKKKIAIAKPLVYDIGWVISDRNGNELKRENFLIQETFFVPNVFNTAYYCNKRPQYMEKFTNRQINVLTWNEAIRQLMEDLDEVDIAVAYNATFDFKKAIPFTEKYIKYLYSDKYNEWEKMQFEKCKAILAGTEKPKNDDYLVPLLHLRGEDYPICDLWQLACQRLINTDRYKNYCLRNSQLTASAVYFKTSAETAFQYLTKDTDFIESHTALEDALIEKEILTKILKKGKIEPDLQGFPFRALGTTVDYVKSKPKYKPVVEDALREYLAKNDGYLQAVAKSGYWTKILKMYEEL